MSTYPTSSPIEERKPSFLRRPVPMWAFLLLVITIVLLLIIPGFLPITAPTVHQPLILSPDSRTVFINSTETTTANFTVANINTTNTISATATVALLRPNTSLKLSNTNITLTILGVQTGNTFVASNDGKSVSFPPGGNILVVKVVAANATPQDYAVQVTVTS